MQKIAKQVRQGDVLVTPVTEIPSDARKATGRGSIVVAEGEMTGHAHRIRKPGRKVERFDRNGDMFLKVAEPTTVEHEEHGAVTLEPGVYIVQRQVEVWLDEVRQVAD